MYTFRYVCRQTYISLYVCMHTICISILYSHVNIHMFGMSLNKYGCHIANMRHTAIMLCDHTDPTFCIQTLKHNKLQHILHMLLTLLGLIKIHEWLKHFHPLNKIDMRKSMNFDGFELETHKQQN